jgi:hypothetical protein
MAIKIGKKSEESSFKLFQGICAFKVVAINPTKKEYKEILNREVEEEPSYTSKNDKDQETSRVTFYVQTDANSNINNGIVMNASFSFTLVKAKRTGTQSGKIQIIDKYGRTAWATPEEVEKKDIPMYANGPAPISAEYRPACQGEEDLINFMKTWLNIPDTRVYNRTNNTWTEREDKSDCEISLDLKKLFAGDYSELKDIITVASDFLVKGVAGVRTTDKGKQYQAIFTRFFLKNASSNYIKLEKEVTDFKNTGGAADTEYDFANLHEYKVTASSFKKQDATEELPDFNNKEELPF